VVHEGELGEKVLGATALVTAGETWRDV